MEHTTHTEEAQRQAGEALDKTRAQAADTVRTAAASGSTFFDNQKRLAAVEVDGYACALHETARRLHDQSQDRVADYTERLARGLDRFAGELRERDLRDAVDRVSDFARRQPMLFVGGAIAAGFAFTRFLKSSADSRDRSRFSDKVREGVEQVKESAGDTAEHLKSSAGGRDEKSFGEKFSEGVEHVKESARETVHQMKEKSTDTKDKVSEAAKREERHGRKRTDTRQHTAAEVEVPVILKPHEPDRPEGPAPKA